MKELKCTRSRCRRLNFFKGNLIVSVCVSERMSVCVSSVQCFLLFYEDGCKHVAQQEHLFIFISFYFFPLLFLLLHTAERRLLSLFLLGCESPVTLSSAAST